MEYHPWVNTNRGGPYANVRAHAEWNDYLDILGKWDHRPTWREIIAAYRKQNALLEMASDEISWDQYKR